MIPVEQAREFVRLLRAASAQPVVYAELPRAQHAFDVLGSVRARHSAAVVGDFLGVLYGDHRRARLEDDHAEGAPAQADRADISGGPPKPVSQ